MENWYFLFHTLCFIKNDQQPNIIEKQKNGKEFTPGNLLSKTPFHILISVDWKIH